MLASIESRFPSTVSAGRSLCSLSIAVVRSQSRFLSSYRARVASFGETMTVPRFPSTITSSPVFTHLLMSESPRTAGISPARARMAVWDVLPPASAAMPRTSVRSRPRVSEGIRLCVTRMEGSRMSERRVLVVCSR